MVPFAATNRAGSGLDPCRTPELGRRCRVVCPAALLDGRSKATAQTTASTQNNTGRPALCADMLAGWPRQSHGTDDGNHAKRHWTPATTLRKHSRGNVRGCKRKRAKSDVVHEKQLKFRSDYMTLQAASTAPHDALSRHQGSLAEMVDAGYH